MTTAQQTSAEHNLVKSVQFLPLGEQAQLPVPFVRVTTCGLLTIEVVTEMVSSDPPLARYLPLTSEQLHGRGTVPAFMLLKLLLNRHERFATRDWLIEQFCRDRELFSSVRLDNIVSQLRGLLCPPAYRDLRKQMVAHVRGSSGDGYQLAAYPFVWVDQDALAWNIEQATRMERFGDNALPFWERAYELARRGPYLPDERYADWASFRREQTASLLRQSVLALARLYQVQHGPAGEEEAALLLRTYWLEHQREEDALRLLMELLGRQECIHEALGYYERLCDVLKEEMREPDSQTQDVAAYLRNKQLERPGSLHATLQREQQEAVQMRLLEQSSLLPQREPEVVPFSPSNMAIAQGIMLWISQQLSAQHPSLVGLTSEQADFLSSFLKELSMTEVDIAKRQTLRQIAAVIGVSLTHPQSLISSELWKSGFSPETGREAETLDRYTKLLALCWNLLKGNDWATVAYVLPTFLSEIEEQVRHASRSQSLLAGFAAQAYLIHGLVVGHQNNLSAKLLSCQRAMDYGQLAHNPDLATTALIQQAVTFDSQKKYENSFRLYQQASLSVDHLSPLLGARVLAGLAGSYARCGQHAYEAQRHLDRAHTFMPDHPEADPSFLYADCGPFTLPLWEGRIAFELDQLEHAFQIFARAKNQERIPERIRTEFLNHLLETSIAQGDLDQSLACLQEANQAALHLQSERRQREVLEAYHIMLHLWRHDRTKIQEAFEISTCS